MTENKRYPRTDRLSESIREVIADEIERLTDPRIGFVTITGADVSPDLRYATIWYSVLGDDEQRVACHAGLKSAAGHLRHTVGVEMRIKRAPELTFKEDPAIATGLRVEEIIRHIQREETIE